MVTFGLLHNVFDMKIPICLRSGKFRRTLRITVSSLRANPGRGFDVSQYQKYHISSIWCICNHAWITHDIHVQYYVEICMFSTLVNRPFATIPRIQFCASFWGWRESWSSTDAGKATWIIMAMHVFEACVHHRLNWVLSPYTNGFS